MDHLVHGKQALDLPTALVEVVEDQMLMLPITPVVVEEEVVLILNHKVH